MRQLAQNFLGRAWYSFCVFSILGGFLFLLEDGDNLVASDDPYLVGFACGIVAAVLSLACSLTRYYFSQPRYAHIGYFIAIGLWSTFLLLMSRGTSEGEEPLHFLAGASFVLGILVWALNLRPPQKWPLRIATALGVLGIFFYLIVVFRMAQK